MASVDVISSKYCQLTEPGKYFDFKNAAQKPTYTDWLDIAGHTELNKFVFTHYIDFKLSGINFENNLVFLNNRSSHGFRFTGKHSENMSYEFLNNWQIYLTEKLQTSRYIIHLAKEITESNGQNQSSRTIYLKPSVKLPLEDGKLSQLYGNIHIETRKLSQSESQFKLLVHHYNDRNYNPSYDFESLMIYLFQE